MPDVNVVGNLILQNGNATGAISQIQKQLGNANLKLEFDQKSVSQMLGAFEASRKLGRSVRETGQAFREAVTQTDAFSRSLAISVRRFGAFFTVAQPILLLVQNLQKATQEFLIFDRQLVKLKQLGSSTVEIGKLVKEIDTLSTTFGVKSNDILKAAETLKQAGFSLNEITKAVKALGQTTLAPTFDDITSTTEGLLAVVQQFNLSIDDSATILSKVNKVAADYAVESRDIIEAVKRTGSTFKLAGGNFDEFLALFTSVRATTRLSAETIANSFKTIFTRIQRPEIIEQLDRLGIQVVDLEGKFVGPFEAIKRLNQALSAVPDASPQFTQLAEKLAGLFQINKLVPLIRQFDVAQQALNTSLGAGNSLYDQSIIAQEALSVKLTKLQEQFFELFRSVGSSTAFRDLIDDMIGLTKWTVQMIKNFEFLTGTLIDLGKVAAVVLSVRTVASIAKFVGSTGKSVRLAGGGTTKDGTMGPLFKPQGTDTVPAMLTPGEYVVNRKSAQSNKALLEYINNSKGPVYRARGGVITAPFKPRSTFNADVANFDLQTQRRVKLNELEQFQDNFKFNYGIDLRKYYNKVNFAPNDRLRDGDSKGALGLYFPTSRNIVLNDRLIVQNRVRPTFIHETMHGVDNFANGFDSLRNDSVNKDIVEKVRSLRYETPTISLKRRKGVSSEYLNDPREIFAYTMEDYFSGIQHPEPITELIEDRLIPTIREPDAQNPFVSPSIIKDTLKNNKGIAPRSFVSKLFRFPLGFAKGGKISPLFRPRPTKFSDVSKLPLSYQQLIRTQELEKFQDNFQYNYGIDLRRFYNEKMFSDMKSNGLFNNTYDASTGKAGEIVLNNRLLNNPGELKNVFTHEAMHGVDSNFDGSVGASFNPKSTIGKIVQKIKNAKYQTPSIARRSQMGIDPEYLNSPQEIFAYTMEDYFKGVKHPEDITSIIEKELIPSIRDPKVKRPFVSPSKIIEIAKKQQNTKKRISGKLFSRIRSKFPLGFATGGSVPSNEELNLISAYIKNPSGFDNKTKQKVLYIYKKFNDGIGLINPQFARITNKKIQSTPLGRNIFQFSGNKPLPLNIGVQSLPKITRQPKSLPPLISKPRTKKPYLGPPQGPLGPPRPITIDDEVDRYFNESSEERRASQRSYLRNIRLEKNDAARKARQDKYRSYIRDLEDKRLAKRSVGKLGRFGLLGKLFGYNQGGISGSFYRKPSPEDTVPAMLTPGEFIVNADSAKHNMDLLEQINRNKAPLGFNKGGPVAYLASGGRGNKTQEEIDLERLQRRREQAQKRTDVEGAQERKRVRREDAQRIAEEKAAQKAEKAAQRAELDRAREAQRIEQDRVRRIAREVASGNISREVATSPEFKNRIENRKFFAQNKSIFEAEGIVNADKFDKAIRERKELFKEQEKNRRPFAVKPGPSAVDAAIERRVQEKAENIEANKRIRAGFNESGRRAREANERDFPRRQAENNRKEFAKLRAEERAKQSRDEDNRLRREIRAIAAQEVNNDIARQNAAKAGFTTGPNRQPFPKNINKTVSLLEKRLQALGIATKDARFNIAALADTGSITSSARRQLRQLLSISDEDLAGKLGLQGDLSSNQNQRRLLLAREKIVANVNSVVNDPNFIKQQRAQQSEITDRKDIARQRRENAKILREERRISNFTELARSGQSQKGFAAIPRLLASGKINSVQAAQLEDVLRKNASPLSRLQGQLPNFPSITGFFGPTQNKVSRDQARRKNEELNRKDLEREATRKGLTVDELKQQNKLQRRNNALKGLGAVAFVAGSGLTQRGGQVDDTLRELFAGGTVAGAGGTGPSPIDALNQAVLFGGIGAQFGGNIGAAAGAGAGLILGIESYQRDLKKAINDNKINQFNKFFEGQLSNQLTESGTRLTEIRGNRNLSQRDINAQSAKEIAKSNADSIALLDKQRKVLLANGRAGNITREEFDLQESGIKERATSIVRQNLEQLIGVGATDEQIKPLTDALASLTGQDAEILRKSYLAQRDAIKDQIIELDKSAALLAEQNIFYSQIADSSKNLQIAQLRYSDALESIGGITSGAGLKKSSGLSLFGAPRTGTPQDEVNQKAFLDTVKSLTTDQNTIKLASDANILAGSQTEFAKFIEANKVEFASGQDRTIAALRSFAEQSGIQNIDEFIKAFRVRSNEIVQNGNVNNNVIQQIIQDYIQQTGQVVDTLKAEEEFRKSLNESLVQSKVAIVNLENDLNKLSIQTQDSLVSLSDLRSDSLALVDPRFSNTDRGPQFNFADIDTQARDARNDIASLNDLDLTKDTRVEQAKYIQSIQNSIEALNKFANSTQKISQLQQTIQKVQASQQNKLGFVEQFLTSDQAGRFQIARNVNDAQLVGRALNGGNRQVLNQMTPADLKRILETFRGFGDNQVGTTGASGNQLAQELLNTLARMNPILARFLGNNGDILGGGDEGRAERLRNSEEAIAALGEQTIPGLVAQIENEIAKREEAVQSIEEFNKALINFQIKQQEAAQGLAEAALNSKPQVANIQAQQVNVNPADFERPPNGGRDPIAPQARAFGGSIKPRAVGSDTVPAMLTPGEFIVNAQAARKNKGILNLINSGKVALMASGGTVDQFGRTQKENDELEEFVRQRDKRQRIEKEKRRRKEEQEAKLEEMRRRAREQKEKQGAIKDKYGIKQTIPDKGFGAYQPKGIGPTGPRGTIRKPINPDEDTRTSQQKRRENGRKRYEAEQERKRNEITAERNRIKNEREIQRQERRRRYESGESGRIERPFESGPGIQTDSRIQNSGKGAAVAPGARPDQTRPREFAQNLKEERGARQNGGVGAANINMQDFQNFAASINAAADKFANIKIPETININTNGKVEVILNGAQVLASITGDLQKQIAIEIQNQIPKIIEAATAKIQTAPPVA